MPRPVHLSIRSKAIRLIAPALLLLILVAGCTPEASNRRQSSTQSATQRQANQSAVLLRSAIDRLQDLPNALDLELSPPSVVLDARSSLDGEEIEAEIATSDGSPDGELNRLVVRSRNAGFQREVQPGDIVKCYLLPDRETRERIRETGEPPGALSNFEAVELRVAQVLGPNSLRLEQGLRIPTGIAQELGASLPEPVAEALREIGFSDPRSIVNTLIEQIDQQGGVTSEGVPLPQQFLGLLPGIAWPFRVEVWRINDDRMLDINTALDKYAALGEPSFGWEPSADTVELAQLMQRVNQWTRGRDQPQDWRPAELLSTLAPTLREDETLAAYTSDSALGRTTFAPYESRLVQEAIWLRDISRWASGDRFDPVKRAARLFDWVVRNVTLSDSPRVTTNRPWQTLIAGRGGAAQRAWVFAGLCRQQQVPVVVLEFPQPEGEPWLLCGVLDEARVSLFDPQLGLPLYADAEGESIATLADLKANPGLLRQLDLTDSTYPLTAESFAGVQPALVAEPMSLSWRAAELQGAMRGANAVVLSVDADILAEQFNQLAEQAGLGGTRLWEEPFDYFRRRLRFGQNARNAQRLLVRPYAWRPVLWQGRTLHFRGMFETEQQAKQKALRSGDALYEAINDHRRAAQRYMNPSVRPSNSVLARVPRDKARVYVDAKVDATYWLALLKHDQGAYKQSLQWLENPTLSVPAAKDRQDGVRYNRSRALEAMGQAEAAAELLEQDRSPQRHGNRLRAKLLRGEPLAAAGNTSQTPPPDKAAENQAAENQAAEQDARDASETSVAEDPSAGDA